jgi:hypothetical protein
MAGEVADGIMPCSGPWSRVRAAGGRAKAPNLGPLDVTLELPPFIGEDRGAMEDVLTRFLRAYLAGDTGGLAYLEVPGARIAAVAGRLELLSLPSISTGRSGARGRRVVMATVHVRDLESRALYTLRYRVALVRRDRWYVAEINGPGEG